VPAAYRAEPPTVVNITANGSDGPVTLNSGAPLLVEISADVSAVQLATAIVRPRRCHAVRHLVEQEFSCSSFHSPAQSHMLRSPRGEKGECMTMTKVSVQTAVGSVNRLVVHACDGYCSSKSSIAAVIPSGSYSRAI